MSVALSVTENREPAESSLCPSHASWREALKAEVASAGALPDMERFRGIIQSYDKLGMQGQALSLINRMIPFSSDRRDVLPFLIESLIRQGALANLNQAVRLALGFDDPPLTLCRPLARAFSLLGQVEPAARKWHKILTAKATEEPD